MRSNRAAFIKSEKGASSVLVALVLIVLVILGVAALTISLASGRLGDKSVKWYKDYYALDLKAENVFARIDNEAMLAHSEAKKYIQDKRHTDKESLSDKEMQSFINTRFREGADESALEHTVFLYFLRVRLEAMTETIDFKSIGNEKIYQNFADDYEPVLEYIVSISEGTGPLIYAGVSVSDERLTVVRWIRQEKAD